MSFELSIRCEWKSIGDIVGFDGIANLTFPPEPSIYQFLFSVEGRSVKAYIGQTSNLKKRMAAYSTEIGKPGNRGMRRPTWNQEGRVVGYIERAFAKGAAVSLQTVQFGQLQIDKDSFTLSNPFVRLMIENMAILDAAAKGIRIINVDHETKLLRRAMKKVMGSANGRVLNLLLHEGS